MSRMSVPGNGSFRLTVDVELEDAEQDRLVAIFGANLQSTLAQLAAAAVREYVLAFTGEPAPATLRGVRELRLALLFRHLRPLRVSVSRYGDGVPQAGGSRLEHRPTDRQVEQLFQMTPTQAINLIAGSHARFPELLELRLRDEAKEALANGTRTQNERTLDVLRIKASDSLARYLKELVARTTAPPIEKRRDASQTYDLLLDTVSELNHLL